jgi:hypothetical protein
MDRSISFALCLLAVCLPVAASPLAKCDNVTHYDPDPAHLWNRMHATLFIRHDRDGKPVGHDALDPVVFPTTTSFAIR